MTAQDRRRSAFDPETDLTHGGTGHGDVIEREQKGVSEGAARDHRVAIDAVIADALPCAGQQADVGSFRQPLGVPVDREPLPVRDARMRILELRGVDAGSRKQVAHRNALRRKLGRERRKTQEVLGRRVRVARDRGDELDRLHASSPHLARIDVGRLRCPTGWQLWTS